jgi:hypothetical protein
MVSLMICFAVSINGKMVGTAGVGDFGVLTAILTWVKVHPERLRKEWPVDAAAEELFFDLAGLTSSEKGGGKRLRWLKTLAVSAGDEIVIRILDQPKRDKPTRSTGASRKRRKS